MKQKHLEILHTHCSGSGLPFPEAGHAFHPISNSASQGGDFISPSSFLFPTGAVNVLTLPSQGSAAPGTADRQAQHFHHGS